MVDLPLTGGCLCGGVRFEVTEPPYLAGYCHCTRCQRRTGTASAVGVRVPTGSHRILAGEELLGSFDPPDGASKVFCTACGAALWSRGQDEPPLITVRMAAFDRDPGIRPSYRQFVANAAQWEPIPDDGLPRFDGRRPSTAS